MNEGKSLVLDECQGILVGVLYLGGMPSENELPDEFFTFSNKDVKSVSIALRTDTH